MTAKTTKATAERLATARSILKQIETQQKEAAEALIIIQTEIKDIRKNTTANSRNHTEQGRVVKKIKDRLDNIEPHLIEAELDRLREVNSELHSRYQLMILQWSTATEVERIIRISQPSMVGAIGSAIIRSFDESREWWWSKKDYSLNSWIGAYAELIKKYRSSDRNEQTS